MLGMSICIGFCDDSRKMMADPEELLTESSFFRYAGVVSAAMEGIRRRLKSPESAALYDAFFGYVAEGRERGQQAFADYLGEYRNALEQALGEDAGGAVELLSGGPALPPDAEAYDPDARAFLGRLVLSGEIVSRDRSAQVFQGLGWLSSVLKRYVMEMRGVKPEYVPAFQFALDVTMKIGGYCGETYQGGPPFGFAV
jgi:hypothetical protein